MKLALVACSYTQDKELASLELELGKELMELMSELDRHLVVVDVLEGFYLLHDAQEQLEWHQLLDASFQLSNPSTILPFLSCERSRNR